MGRTLGIFSTGFGKSACFYLYCVLTFVYMSSERKLQRHIDKLRLSPLLTPPRVPVLLSDSKGFNLKQQVRVNRRVSYIFGAGKEQTL
jgi:hypothetical protein